MKKLEKKRRAIAKGKREISKIRGVVYLVISTFVKVSNPIQSFSHKHTNTTSKINSFSSSSWPNGNKDLRIFLGNQTKSKQKGIYLLTKINIYKRKKNQREKERDRDEWLYQRCVENLVRDLFHKNMKNTLKQQQQQSHNYQCIIRICKNTKFNLPLTPSTYLK